jgi:hypothetical protein
MHSLVGHDKCCKIAKFNVHDPTKRTKLLNKLTKYPAWCWTAPVTRRWSPAMQVVQSGQLPLLRQLVETVPGVDWNARLDGLTSLDVAARNTLIHPQVCHYVYSQMATHGQVGLLPAGQFVASEQPTLEKVQALWADIQAVEVQRPPGSCVICTEIGQPLVSCSCGCAHSCCRGCFVQYLESTLETGPFPVRCPLCKLQQQDPAKGVVTRGLLKGLACVSAGDSALLLQRVLLQQLLHLSDEASLDLVYRTTKACPFCSAPVSHYRGHGCHHIAPGNGCPSCHGHFCFNCLLPQHSPDCSCDTYCSASCGCVACPDCHPGQPCANCDGPHGACPSCNP